MIHRDRRVLQQLQGYGAATTELIHIWSPGELQDEARSINADMVQTDNDTAAADIVENVRASWAAFYMAWIKYFQPIDDSWRYNPLGAAAWANIDQLRDWRSRLIDWQKSLAAAGANIITPTKPSDAVAPSKGFEDVLGVVKWVVVGGIVLVLGVKVLPALTSKKG